MRATAFLLVPLLALGVGCGGDDDGHFEHPDDLGQRDARSEPDLSMPTDLAPPAGDMAMPDLAAPQADLALPTGDMAPPPDLAQADLALPTGDMAPPPDLARIDLATPTGDLAPPATDMTPPGSDDMGDDAATAPSCTPVVNEVQTSTSTNGGTDEFIEVYNPCSGAIDLTGWTLAYRTSANTSSVAPADDSYSGKPLYTFAGSLAANGYLVISGAKFPGASDGALVNGIADDGAVGLRDPSGTLVDSVGFGDVDPANAFVETTRAAKASKVASPGKSISRIPNGRDSDDNSRDFAVTAPPTPGAANVTP